MSDSAKLEQETRLDPRDFRRALGGFVTGVTVVTTTDDSGRPRGFTANSFTSVSLDPPLILACIARSAGSYSTFAGARHFAVNILSEGQREISSLFASAWVDRFASAQWRLGELGVPLLENTVAWFECCMHDRVEAGDHLILIGRVQTYGHSTASPLAYCRGAYVSFQLEQEVMASRSRRTRVGAILEQQGRVIFLNHDPIAILRLPSGRGLGSSNQPDSLYWNLRILGIEFNLDFLYSVYEDEGADTLNIYYRGTASFVPVRPDIELYPLNAIPLERLEDEAMRTLLRRYMKERLDSRFTVYAGNEKTGHYRAVFESGTKDDEL
jgi:flavin-dependent trigonelline monooxygenase, reductase component